MWHRHNVFELLKKRGQVDNPMKIAENSLNQSVEQPLLSSRAIQSLFDVSYSLYVTENYSHTYAYPLIAYLHGQDQSERDLWNWFPAISDQNYLGLGVRAPFPHPHGLPGMFEWKLRRPDASIAAVRDAVQLMQQDWTIHPRRTYLFGEGEGAVVALQNLILQQTLEFNSIFANGVICRALPKCWTGWLPHVNEQLQGRVLLLDVVQSAEEFAALDALTEAGLEITTTQPSSATAAASLINHWVMAGINTAIF